MSKKSPRPPSARAERRAEARAGEKLAAAREKLAGLEAGGSRERAISVMSASEIEPHASSLGCARCGGAARVDEHAAITVGGDRLRVVRLVCLRCSARRDVFFRIAVSH